MRNLEQLHYYGDYIDPFYSELYRNFQTGPQIFQFFFSSVKMITRKVTINLKDIQQSPNYNIVYNQGAIKMLK